MLGQAVLVVCPSRGIPLWGPSGASEHLRAMARAWRGRGARVWVATPTASDHRGAVQAELEGVSTVHVPSRRWPRGLRSWGARRDARRLVRAAMQRARPQLIWERHTAHGLVVAAEAARTGVPRWVELNAPLALEVAHLSGRRVEASAHAREVRSLRAADQVFAVSRWLARWAVEIGCAPHRVHHLPNGAPTPPAHDGAALRARLGLSSRVVGFVGSFKAWHGVQRLPAILDALGPEWTGLAVGDGPQPVAAHPRLQRTGRVSPAQVSRYLAAMDVGLAPYEASAPPWFCPLKVQAYRAQGLAVVATDVGDCAELVGGAGRMLHAQEPQAWAAAIEEAVRLPASVTAPTIRSWDTVLADAISLAR